MSDNDSNLIYCRKCTKKLPPQKFYDAIDNGLVDSNGKMSVCKDCVQKLYDEIYPETENMEKTIHKLCIILNIKFSNDAVDATKKHITTLLEKGKHANAIFSIYKMKLVAINKSMDKSISKYEGYEDIGTIFVDKKFNTDEAPLPADVLDFWGNNPNLTKKDIAYLEKNYANFKQTHNVENYAEVVLLKEVCMTMLDIEKAREQGDDIEDPVKRLQALMKTLEISPDKANEADKGIDTFGLWIEDIERYEPGQWLKSDPRGNMLYDVGNVEEYFQKYIVRPTKNFIMGSKDFNIDEEQLELDDDVDVDKIFMATEEELKNEPEEEN